MLEVPPNQGIFHTLFDPNILLGSYKANSNHLPKFRVASHVTSHKATENKSRTKYTSTSTFHIYSRTLPPPACLREQDSVLQKFIKIYNLPQNCMGYSPPGAQTPLSLYIKCTSPVKVALLRAQWWFLQWRGGLGTDLSGFAVSPDPWVAPQRALLCPRCVWELDLTKSAGFWVQNSLFYTGVPEPGAFQSGQEGPVPPGDAWKSPAKGFLQDIKWSQGSPLASG